MVVRKIVEKLCQRNGQERQLLNTLNLADFLIKNGSELFLQYISEEKFVFKQFQYYSGGELDAEIKSLSGKILGLLQDQANLKAQREIAVKLRKRIKGVSSDTNAPEGSDSQYQGFSSENYISKIYKSETKPGAKIENLKKDEQKTGNEISNVEVDLLGIDL